MNHIWKQLRSLLLPVCGKRLFLSEATRTFFPGSLLLFCCLSVENPMDWEHQSGKAGAEHKQLAFDLPGIKDEKKGK